MAAGMHSYPAALDYVRGNFIRLMPTDYLLLLSFFLSSGFNLHRLAALLTAPTLALFAPENGLESILSIFRGVYI